MFFSLFSARSLKNVGNQSWSSSDAAASLTLSGKAFEIVTQVSHPENLQAAV